MAVVRVLHIACNSAVVVVPFLHVRAIGTFLPAGRNDPEPKLVNESRASLTLSTKTVLLIIHRGNRSGATNQKKPLRVILFFTLPFPTNHTTILSPFLYLWDLVRPRPAVVAEQAFAYRSRDAGHCGQAFRDPYSKRP